MLQSTYTDDIPNSQIARTLHALTTHLNSISSHRTALLTTLNTYFTLPLLTLPSTRRLLCALARLSHTLRNTHYRLNHSSVVAPAILAEIANIGTTLHHILHAATVLVADIEHRDHPTTSSTQQVPTDAPHEVHRHRASSDPNPSHQQQQQQQQQHHHHHHHHPKTRLSSCTTALKTTYVTHQALLAASLHVHREISVRLDGLAERVVKLRRRAAMAVKK